MPSKPEHRRRRIRPRAGVHTGGRRYIMGQKSRGNCRLSVEIGHPGRRHRHVMVVEAVFRRETRRRLHVSLGVNIRRYRRHRGCRRPVLGIPQAQQLLYGERGPLRHRLRRFVENARSRNVYGTL